MLRLKAQLVKLPPTKKLMLKTISRIDKLAEALADFTEEARIG